MYRHKFYGLIVLFNILSCIVAIILCWVVKSQMKSEKKKSDLAPKEEKLNLAGSQQQENEQDKLMQNNENQSASYSV